MISCSIVFMINITFLDQFFKAKVFLDLVTDVWDSNRVKEGEKVSTETFELSVFRVPIEFTYRDAVVELEHEVGDLIINYYYIFQVS